MPLYASSSLEPLFTADAFFLAQGLATLYNSSWLSCLKHWNAFSYWHVCRSEETQLKTLIPASAYNWGKGASLGSSRCSLLAFAAFTSPYFRFCIQIFQAIKLSLLLRQNIWSCYIFRSRVRQTVMFPACLLLKLGNLIKLAGVVTLTSEWLQLIQSRTSQKAF